MTSFPELSSFSSQKDVINCSDSSSKVLEYPEECCARFGPFSLRVKIEETSVSSPPFTFHTFLEPKEVKDIPINSETQSINSFPTQL